MSLSDLLADVVQLAFDSSGAPGGVGGATAGGAGPALGGMGGGDGGGGGGGHDGDADWDEGGRGGGDGGDDRGGADDPYDPYKKDPSVDDLATAAEKAAEWADETLEEIFDFADRKLRGESTADDEIVWEALDKVGRPPKNAKEAAETAVDLAEIGLEVAKTGRATKRADKKRWDSIRGHKGDEHLAPGGDD